VAHEPAMTGGNALRGDGPHLPNGGNTEVGQRCQKIPQLRASSSFSGLISYIREGLTPGIRTVFAYSPFALGGGSAPTLAEPFSASRMPRCK